MSPGAGWPLLGLLLACLAARVLAHPSVERQERPDPAASLKGLRALMSGWDVPPEPPGAWGELERLAAAKEELEEDERPAASEALGGLEAAVEAAAERAGPGPRDLARGLLAELRRWVEGEREEAARPARRRRRIAAPALLTGALAAAPVVGSARPPVEPPPPPPPPPAELPPVVPAPRLAAPSLPVPATRPPSPQALLQRIASGRDLAAAEALGAEVRALFLRGDPAEAVLRRGRELLADPSADVRGTAAAFFGEILSCRGFPERSRRETLELLGRLQTGPGDAYVKAMAMHAVGEYRPLGPHRLASRRSVEAELGGDPGRPGALRRVPGGVSVADLGLAGQWVLKRAAPEEAQHELFMHRLVAERFGELATPESLAYAEAGKAVFLRRYHPEARPRRDPPLTAGQRAQLAVLEGVFGNVDLHKDQLLWGEGGRPFLIDFEQSAIDREDGSPRILHRFGSYALGPGALSPDLREALARELEAWRRQLRDPRSVAALKSMMSEAGFSAERAERDLRAYQDNLAAFFRNVEIGRQAGAAPARSELPGGAGGGGASDSAQRRLLEEFSARHQRIGARALRAKQPAAVAELQAAGEALLGALPQAWGYPPGVRPVSLSVAELPAGIGGAMLSETGKVELALDYVTQADAGEVAQTVAHELRHFLDLLELREYAERQPAAFRALLARKVADLFVSGAYVSDPALVQYGIQTAGSLKLREKSSQVPEFSPELGREVRELVAGLPPLSAYTAQSALRERLSGSLEALASRHGAELSRLSGGGPNAAQAGRYLLLDVCELAMSKIDMAAGEVERLKLNAASRKFLDGRVARALDGDQAREQRQRALRTIDGIMGGLESVGAHRPLHHPGYVNGFEARALRAQAHFAGKGAEAAFCRSLESFLDARRRMEAARRSGDRVRGDAAAAAVLRDGAELLAWEWRLSVELDHVFPQIRAAMARAQSR